MGKIEVSRRSFLKTAAAAVGVEALGLRPADGVSSAATPKKAKTGRPTLIALDNEGIVETVYGKVRGSERNGIHIFLGIPYGANTGGENRFMSLRPGASVSLYRYRKMWLINLRSVLPLKFQDSQIKSLIPEI